MVLAVLNCWRAPRFRGNGQSTLSPKSMPAFADLIPEYGQITQR